MKNASNKVLTILLKKVFFITILCLFFFTSQAQTKVLVLTLKGEIDPRSQRYIELGLAEAKTQKTDIVLIEMDTYGGRVDNADAIRTLLLDFEKPIWVFINKNAASAGALISIACDSIYMASGATIGAATVVTGDGNKASGKYQSYMTEKMRATAQAQKRNPEIAAAMVDDSVQVDSTQKGKVLTLTTEDAIRVGYCEAQVNSVQALLKRQQLEKAQVSYYELSNTEKVIRFFLNPFVSGILLLIVLGGIYFELQTPGVGFPIIASITAALLYFIPHYLNGLAANWELAMLIIGVVLLAAEIFVIPGFGVAGILGTVLSLGALFMMSLDNDWFDFSYVTTTQLNNSLMSLTMAVLGGIALIILGVPLLLKSKGFQRIALQKSMNREEGYNSAHFDDNFVGKIGKAYTVLRPSGKIKIEGELHDAYTQGDFIDKEATIIVIAQEGTSLKVKKIEEEE